MGHKFYFGSRTRLRPGTKIKPFSGKWEAAHMLEREELFERVRKEKFPNKPPRVGSVMLCPSLTGFCSGSPMMGRPYVYEVEVKGARKMHYADGEKWTEAGYSSDPESWAESYWKHEYKPPRKAMFPEVLIEGGTAKVVKLVDPDEEEDLDEAIQRFEDILAEATLEVWTDEG